MPQILSRYDPCEANSLVFEIVQSLAEASMYFDKHLED
ncbi:hypothetical protein SLEP1_g32544 [Rubroshorea leprosula]|uniref:Uncharacterized protein n=1 Tax=Rubroshorea leprosula TaxID=152421 RepID=A0AAV5KDU7_9ROSI|nr:hypothetical protein SLEP1_g32544 [Rubroshorea leprosula]